MKRSKGFTLIELLIVVAIIAILAAIAVPNFLEAQTRSKVSRVKGDQRTLATGLESYYVDNNSYPVWTTDPNKSVNNLGDANTGAAKRHSFRVWTTPNEFHTLTTPISYLTSYFRDPFADTKGATFGYYADDNGWIVWSYGPDTDEDSTDASKNSDIDADVETLYNSGISQPSYTLIAMDGASGESYTYDATNGTISPGDVWRVKQ
ncbi:prepilin-type N-terminal cleavage/methylation domain-containing protein [Candidatus Sumerlaeota bacterium]|nr:prepilin-type N-terminal cleavage/methylation domain-containing protein [Candidatus Sumerlaeota bacterium]